VPMHECPVHSLVAGMGHSAGMHEHAMMGEETRGPDSPRDSSPKHRGCCCPGCACPCAAVFWSAPSSARIVAVIAGAPRVALAATGEISSGSRTDHVLPFANAPPLS
jgi:hypothetical protein